jgi:glycine/sarcosine/betaine reductase complex component A
MLDGKKIIILGDRDGIPGGAIEQCLQSKELVIVFSTTECFV